MAPVGRHINERPKHERPLMRERMGQDKRPRAGTSEVGHPSAPMTDEAVIIDDVDVERARTPWSAPAAPGAALDPLQHAKQCLRGESRVEQCHRIDVSGLPGIAHRFGLVERRDGRNGDMSAFDFAQSLCNCTGGSPPRSGTICAKSYYGLAMRAQLRSHAVTPMLSTQASSDALARGCSLTLQAYCIERSSHEFLSDRAHRALHRWRQSLRDRQIACLRHRL